jgi:beta-lactamase superfamily II metal-dependent hydrolase
VKLKAFHAADGDCLLLTSSDGRHALVDGGRARSFDEQAWPVLRAMAAADEPIDLLVVSHIDADHITGILRLMQAVAAWAVHDYQTTAGGNPGAPEPPVDRPPAIGTVWHNSWRAQLADLAGPIEALVVRASDALATSGFDAASAPVPLIQVVDALDGLAESIPQGVDLLRLVDDDTPIPRNVPFDDLVLLRAPPHVQPLGSARLTVIGPSVEHLEALRTEWRTWLDRLKATEAPGSRTGPASGGDAAMDVEQARAAARAEGDRFMASLEAATEVIAATDPSKVTPPNRASITLLAEEDGRTCLLTGDAAERELLDGLMAAGRIADGQFCCNVLKVQHHGSEHNLSTGFAATVLADDYVFCGDGAHGNPDPSVVKTIVEARRQADPGPFTLWFNCSPERTAATRRAAALRRAIREATAAAAAHPQVSVNVLDDAAPFLEIPV